MLNPMLIFLFSVTIWRLSSMLAKDHGPFCIFDLIRFAFGCRYISEEVYEEPEPGSLCWAVLCPGCSSVWIAAMLGPWFLYWSETFTILTSPIWISGIVVMLERLVESGKSTDE